MELVRSALAQASFPHSRRKPPDTGTARVLSRWLSALEFKNRLKHSFTKKPFERLIIRIRALFQGKKEIALRLYQDSVNRQVMFEKEPKRASRHENHGPENRSQQTGAAAQ